MTDEAAVSMSWTEIFMLTVIIINIKKLYRVSDSVSNNISNNIAASVFKNEVASQRPKTLKNKVASQRPATLKNEVARLTPETLKNEVASPVHKCKPASPRPKDKPTNLRSRFDVRCPIPGIEATIQNNGHQVARKRTSKASRKRTSKAAPRRTSNAAPRRRESGRPRRRLPKSKQNKSPRKSRAIAKQSLHQDAL